MNMMAPYGDEIVTDILLHAAFVLTAIAYLVRDILWLRLLAIAANLAVGTAAYRAGMDPNWIVVAWTAAFVVINLGHSAWLIYERHMMRFSAEEQRLYETAFQALDRVCVRRLLRRGAWTEVPERDCLVRQGVHLERLLLIVSGEAAVLLGGKIVARLGCGKFIGEIAYLSDEPATATVVATQPLRCLVWRKEDLAQAFRRRPELLNTLHGAIGKDLADKVASHNVRLSAL